MRNQARTHPRLRRPNGPPRAAGRPPAGRWGRPTVLDQVFDGDGLTALRSAVAAYATELGAGRRIDDVVLVAHELASNVIRHGGGYGRLRLWRTDAAIRCRVSDSGPGLVGIGADELPSPQVPGGRGLWIARRLAAVTIETGPDGTIVTATMSV
jgi:anti-sigma regulatory factor (Ser/Thr protein kinase)